jgi:uncharacterized FlaG/YvyC family protein
MTSKIKNEMNGYVKARKQLWMENDTLNKIENQKIYEKEIRKILLRFVNFKRDASKKFKKELKAARRSATRYSEKILEKNIKKIAKELNKWDVKAVYDYDDMLDTMRKMDFEYMKEFQDDLKLANVQASKFNMGR